MPRPVIPFFVQQPDDLQIVEVFGLPGTDPDTSTDCRWYSLLGQLVLPDLTMRSTMPGLTWRATRRTLVTPAICNYDVPTVEQFVADGNCEVCASQRIEEFYALEQWQELFPTDDDGTEEERRNWGEYLFGDDPEPDDDGHVPTCPNCSQPW